MNKYEGITTISSKEYRELIEDAANYKSLYNELLRDNGRLDDKCREIEAELKAARDEATQNSFMCDYYRGEIKRLKEELRAYESGEEVASG